MQKVYTKIESIVGNVVTVKAEGVRLGDLALVGDSYATVIKLDRDIVSLQVFAGAQGVGTNDSVRFLDRPMMVSFSEHLLGRVFDGAGVPRDHGPALTENMIPIGGPSFNPAKRILPKNMIRTGIPMIDVFNTLVESQKLPIFSISGEPYNALLSRIALQAEVDVIVFGPQFIGRIEVNAERLSKGRLLIYVGDNCPSFAESYRELVADCSSKAPDVTITEDDYGAIYFSSGTTGFPKAILHKHRSLTQAAEMEQKHHGTGRYDTFLCIPPLYHTGAKFHWMGSLVAGSKAVLLKGTKPETILKAVSDEECTIVWLLVPWAQDILDALDRGDVRLSDYRLDQWRLMHIGAQPVPPSLIKRWKEYFPKHQYDTNYGLSESTGPGCVHLGVENINKVGAIGIPGYRWECKIVDEDGNEVKQGDVGELCVKGPGVMTCYYRNEEATKEVLKDGWLYTGDMAMQDEDGFYFLVDRKKDVIVSGGENIYPVQIEDFIRRFNKVKDVAVIGLPDHRLGEKTAAIIEVKDGAVCTKEEIEDFCMELPRYKRPKEIIFADIPRNATGKIEKPKLRKMYGADRLVEQENKG